MGVQRHRKGLGQGRAEAAAGEGGKLGKRSGGVKQGGGGIELGSSRTPRHPIPLGAGWFHASLLPDTRFEGAERNTSCRWVEPSPSKKKKKIIKGVEG